MAERRFRDQLKRELEGPGLPAPSPSQARYDGLPAGGPLPRLRLAGGLALGAAASLVLLAAGFGSPNPQVWTVRVVSALSQLGGPAPVVAPAASPSPTATPAEREAGPEPREGQTETPEPSSPGEPGEGSMARPIPEPSESPEGAGGELGGNETG